MRIFLASAICFLTAIFVLSANPNPAAKDEFSVSLKAPANPLKAGTEIRLNVTITNISDHDVLFARTPGTTPDETLSNHVEIHDEQGHVPDQTPYFRNLNENPSSFFGSFVTHTLGPGKSFDDAVVVTRLYTLTNLGKYRIWVARGQQPLRLAPKYTVRSNEVTVLVTP
jgi:hypothetical protein